MFHVLSISLPARITTQTKPGLVTEHHNGPLFHTLMLMFQTPVQTSAFMRRLCLEILIPVAIVNAEPSALAVRYPSDVERPITRYRSWRGVVTFGRPDTGCRVISPVLSNLCRSLEITDWSTFRIRDTSVSDREVFQHSTILPFVNMSN
ncbi:hypothetical protein TNCV_1937781 [Trichonephila clavipes]|nr:hypothetical protein TNCV_1937781 [Trichonephila clavipes]